MQIGISFAAHEIKMLCVQQDFPSKPYYWNILKYEIESIIDTFVPLKKTRKTV